MRRPHRLLLIACATVLVLAVGGLSAFALAGRSPRTVAVRLSGTGDPAPIRPPSLQWSSNTLVSSRSVTCRPRYACQHRGLKR